MPALTIPIRVGRGPHERSGGRMTIAVLAMLALSAAACGADDDVVTGGGTAMRGESTSGPAVSTSGPTSTTSAPTATTTATPSTTVPEPAGVAVDPEQYVTEEKRAELATLGETAIPLPTWVPAWAAGTPPAIGSLPDIGLVFVQWSLEPDHPYAQEIGQGTVAIDFSRERVRPDFEPLTGPTIEGTVRTYTLSPMAVDCIEGVGPGPVILLWDDDGYRHAVSMKPEPSCYPDDFSVAQAVAFADSLAICDPTGATLECGSPPTS
jgi:hypothetical protein